MNDLLADVKKLLKEEIKGKSSYRNFMALIQPIDRFVNQRLNQLFRNSEKALSLQDIYLISVKNRLDDIEFDLLSLKKEVSYNDGVIDFGNIDTYDDYAIEDIFKNTHILVKILQSLD